MTFSDPPNHSGTSRREGILPNAKTTEAHDGHALKCQIREEKYNMSYRLLVGVIHVSGSFNSTICLHTMFLAKMLTVASEPGGAWQVTAPRKVSRYTNGSSHERGSWMNLDDTTRVFFHCIGSGCNSVPP